MEESIATTTPQPFLGEDWFDPLETAVQTNPDRKSTRLNSSHRSLPRMPSSA